nr:PREDICTED: O-acyltransferase WSD1-like [Daucus carota subsp. sativus]
MELYEEETSSPLSPNGQYLTTSALCLTVLVVFEFQAPIHDLQINSMLRTLFVPTNRRFSSVVVGEKDGVKKWKRVDVDVKEHVKVPVIPTGKSPNYHEKYLVEYLSNISLEPLPEHRPLWEVHVFPYPTLHAAGTLIFKLHHALGDGYSFLGAFLSMMKRADDPSLSVSFPSFRSSNSIPKSLQAGYHNNVRRFFKCVPRMSSWIFNTVKDFGWSVLKSSVLKDDLSPIRSGDDVGLELLPMDMSAMEFSLDQIKKIKTSLKVTVNDVVTGVILLGTRLYMESKEKNSGDSNSTAMVLLNTRNMEAAGSMPWGNHFGFLPLQLPKLSNTSPDHDPSLDFNPLDFVYETHRVIKRKRNNPAAFLTGALLDFAREIRGPKGTLRDHPISGLYFLVAGVPQSLRVSVLSYMGKLRIAFAVEKDFIDMEKLKACVETAFVTVSKAAIHS